MSQTLADDSEVVFDQPGKSAGAVEPEGLVPSRRKEETWSEDTEPHQGARRRTMEFDRSVDGELGAASGGVEDGDGLRDDVVPELRPEQQVQHGEEIRTPPRREPRGDESHQPKGPRIVINESVSGPGYMAAQRGNTTGRNRPYSEWSPVATLEGTVSRMQRDLDNLQTEIFEDAENTRARALGATGGTNDNKGSLV